MFIRIDQGDEWSACAGIVELTESENEVGGQKNVSKILFHEHVDDPKDGGIAASLTKLGDRDVTCYKHEAEGPEFEIISGPDLHRFQERSLHAEQNRGDVLEVSCRCGSCQLRIAPSAYDGSSEGWYVPEKDRTKYCARICCCRSCRLTLGFTLQPWTYIPPSQIFTASNEPLVFGPKARETVQIQKLKYYQSSESVLRSFCSECGATMFYQNFERPYIIDMSVGVLRSKFGNGMLREWLEWDPTVVSKRDEATDEELVESWMSSH